jgi:hypothetical protein
MVVEQVLFVGLDPWYKKDLDKDNVVQQSAWEIL